MMVYFLPFIIASNTKAIIDWPGKADTIATVATTQNKAPAMAANSDRPMMIFAIISFIPFLLHSGTTIHLLWFPNILFAGVHGTRNYFSIPLSNGEGF